MSEPKTAFKTAVQLTEWPDVLIDLRHGNLAVPYAAIDDQQQFDPGKAKHMHKDTVDGWAVARSDGKFQRGPTRLIRRFESLWACRMESEILHLTYGDSEPDDDFSNQDYHPMRDVHDKHPVFDRDSWRLEVNCADTQLGYWDWVTNKLESAGLTVCASDLPSSVWARLQPAPDMRTKVSKDRISNILRDMAQLVADDDSFEGSISYSTLDTRCGRHEFMVEAAVRAGNSQGQGSTILVNKDNES